MVLSSTCRYIQVFSMSLTESSPLRWSDLLVPDHRGSTIGLQQRTASYYGPPISCQALYNKSYRKFLELWETNEWLFVYMVLAYAEHQT